MNHDKTPGWMRVALWAAAAYNVAWGAFVVAFPLEWFRWVGMAAPNYPQLWQCIGMIVGVYGVGYAIAAADPMRHWPIVLVGLLGKVFGPLGFALAVARGEFPLAFGLTIVFNDLIWWLPFGLILRRVYRAWLREEDRRQAGTVAELLHTAHTQHGVSLGELSGAAPTLTIFLRHFG
jgi:hypothetical protein